MSRRGTGWVPPAAAEAAHDTLGGALAVAQQLPDRVGAALVEAAQAAFTNGLQVTAAIGAVVAIGIAILATTLLRSVRTGSGSEGQPGLEPDGTVPAGASVEVLDPACAES